MDFFTRRRAQGPGFKADGLEGLIDQIGPMGLIGPIKKTHNLTSSQHSTIKPLLDIPPYTKPHARMYKSTI